MVAAAAAAVVVVVRGGKLSRPRTARGGMRVLGVFENLVEKKKTNCLFRRHT